MTAAIPVFDVFRLGHDRDDLLVTECPGCEGPVTFHQPDEEQPDRLLGTCPSCSAWYLADARAAVMVRLPDLSALHDVHDPDFRDPEEPSDVQEVAPARMSSTSRRSRAGLHRFAV